MQVNIQATYIECASWVPGCLNSSEPDRWGFVLCELRVTRNELATGYLEMEGLSLGPYGQTYLAPNIPLDVEIGLGLT